MTRRERARRDRRRYWRSLPASSLAVLALAVFLTFCSVAFVSDLAEPRPSPYWWVLVYAADSGIIAAAYALTSTRFLPWLPLAGAINILSIFGLPKLLPLYSTKVGPGTTVAQLHQRHLLDAWLILVVVTLGYMFFFSFIGIEGTKYFGMRREMELAERVQTELVPPIHMTAGNLEIYGRSMPSSRVGGDLVDAVAFNQSVTCYLADVSGHGIAAGVLMSMVKSAARMTISQGEPLAGLMRRLNEVLLDLKEPEAFVTLACLRSRGGGRLEYSLAGHPPMLHYHSLAQAVSYLRMEQLPIAMFRRVSFHTDTIEVMPGDLLVIVSDGFLEVANSKGEEFGVEALGKLIARNATQPLALIADRLTEAAARYGSQEDDQSILLLREVGPATRA